MLPSTSGDDLVKRVIGVGGDTIECCSPKGQIIRNGEPLDEPYIYPGNPTDQVEFRVEVPEGRLFVMGDHRYDSADSRFHLDTDDGTVPVENVVGTAEVIMWPPSRWATLPTYAEEQAAMAGPHVGGARPMTQAPTLRLERSLLRAGATTLACIDEVGRGALAGPVSVGVVVIDAGVRSAPRGLRDSKLLTPRARRELLPRLKGWPIASAVGHADPFEVDAVGIICALRVAAARAFADLGGGGRRAARRQPRLAACPRRA